MNNVVLDSCLERYFKLALEENYPHTPAKTKVLDELEVVIRKEKAECSIISGPS